MKKYLDTYMLVIVLVIVSSLQWFEIINDSEFLGVIVSVITIYFGILKYRIENDRVFKNLFDSFNKRYTSDFNDFLMTVQDKKEYKLDKKEINIVVDYLNLCSEEYLWSERGRIPKKIWKAWRSGILVNLSIDQIREVYNNEMKTEDGKKSYYGLDKELRKYLIKY